MPEDVGTTVAEEPAPTESAATVSEVPEPQSEPTTTETAVETEDPGVTLEELLSGLVPDKTEEQPILPRMVETDDDGEITEQDLEEFEREVSEVISEASSERDEALAKAESLSSEIESLNKQLEESKASANAVEEAWQKVQAHPVAEKIVRAILEGRDPDIPELVSRAIVEDAESLPSPGVSMSPSAKTEAEKTLQDVFNTTPTASWK